MRTVLVTGGSGAIGAAIVRRFAAQGDRVAFGCFRHLDGAHSLEEELRAEGKDVRAFVADLTRPEGAELLFSAATEWAFRVDVLVNNAGISRIGLFTDGTEQEDQALFSLNFWAAARLCRLAVPGMVQRKSGKIINISSMWGLHGASCEAVYSASKAALIGLTQALGKELAPSGVRVNAVAPGVIDTPMNRALGEEALRDLAGQTPASRLGTPEDIANCVAFLASEESSFLVGQTLCADGGFL